ncbi:unnamed protein product [Somion occarium]
MAARLASSLISHVLFLKSQIPFPVAQLARMPGGRSNNRAAKKREDLINAIDTLSSHLNTTFIALSTAFAHRGTESNVSSHTKIVPEYTRPPTQAHIAIVLGPSVGAAKARIMFIVDGLEVKIWDARELPKESASRSPSPSIADGDKSDSDSVTESDDEVEESDGEGEDSEFGSLPPLSRSPSPCTEAQSEPPFQVWSEPSSQPSSAPLPSYKKREPLRDSPSRYSTPGTMPSSHISNQPNYEEQQQTLRVADRLLSRTLASACAEDDGGMSCELAPTQMHILLRAPRRFRHSAWIPRQNLTRSLEGTLDSFLKDSIVDDDAQEPILNQKKRATRIGVKTEGVWVGCKAQTTPIDFSSSGDGQEPSNEDDEMIWWVWDGKIAGFSDW